MYFSVRENIALRSQLEQMRRFIQEREQKYIELSSVNEGLVAEVSTRCLWNAIDEPTVSFSFECALLHSLLCVDFWRVHKGSDN